MSKSPIQNAAVAMLYIIAVASFMFYLPKTFAENLHSVIVPIAMLSLFVLSAATMGYVFCYQPLMLYFEGQKKEAVNLFLRTLAVFAGLTLIVFCILFFLGSR